MNSKNNNTTAIIICSTVGLLIVALVIIFIVWQKNKASLNNSSFYNNVLSTIGLPIDIGTQIEDVLLNGMRNDDVASAVYGGGKQSSIFG